MKLIHKSTGREVREGDTVHDFRGEVGVVTGWAKPHSPASTGRITVDHKGIKHHCYPSVYSCEWIDREDRKEEPQPTPVGGLETETSSVFGIPYKDLGSPDKPLPLLPPVSSFDRTAQLMAEVEENFKKIQETLNEIKALLS